MISALALSNKFSQTIRIFVVVFALLMLVAVIPAPSQASGLTQPQIQSILSLLQSFGADQSVINEVAIDLGATTVPTSGTTGSMTLSVSPSPASQTVIGGSLGVMVANLLFDASGSSEDILLSGADVIYNDNMPNDPVGCQLYDGATALNTGAHVVNPNNNFSGLQAYSFVFDTNTTVAKGTVKTLTLKCSIPSSATSGSFNWGEMAGTAMCGTGVTSGKAVCPTVVTNTGSTMSLSAGGAGSLTASLDASSPAYSLVAAGSTGVMLGVFKFHAANENILLNKVRIYLASSATPQDINELYLYDGPSLIGTGVFLGTQYGTVITLSQPLNISKDSDKNITVKADIANVGNGQPARSGDLIQIGLQFGFGDMYGTGVNSGSTIQATGSNASTAGVRIFKSFPTISLVPIFSSSNIPDGKFIRFAISANPSGPVGIAQLGFTLSGQSPSTNGQADLYAYSDSSFSQPVPGFISGALNGAQVVGSGGYVRVMLPQPVEIPPGATYYFELHDSTKGTGIVGSSIVTTLLGENGYQGLSPYNSAYQNGPLMAWSPNSTTTSSYAQSDWTNAYQLPGLPTGGITQVRTWSTTVVPTSTTPAPTCAMTASPASITVGQTTTLSWTSQNATTISNTSLLVGLPSTSQVNGSIQVSRTTSGPFTYHIDFNGPGGTTTCSAIVNVTAPIAVGGVVVSGNPLAPAIAIAPNVAGRIFGRFNLTAGSSENVLLNKEHFTVRTIADSGIGAGVTLSNFKITIGGVSYTTTKLTSGIYSTYQINLGSGVVIPKGTSISAIMTADIGNSNGASIDLWLNQGDFGLIGVTSGASITPTSPNSTDANNFYWSGYFEVRKTIASASMSDGLASAYAAIGEVLGTSTSALTEAQVQAILNLLSSFGASNGVIANVTVALKGGQSTFGNHDEGQGDSSSSNNQTTDNHGNGTLRSAPPACVLLARTLQKGDKGDDVMQLQKYLQNHGDFMGASTTGFFGPATEAALKHFQMREGVAASSTAGLGIFGPITRGKIVSRCMQMEHQGMGSSTQSTNTTQTPMCILRANKDSIAPGETVTLYWESKFATSASAPNGSTGPVVGSLQVSPMVTSTYEKKVFGPGGEGSCIKTITVASSTPTSTQPIIVVVPGEPNLAAVVSAISSGVAAVMDAYLGLFGLSLE